MNSIKKTIRNAIGKVVEVFIFEYEIVFCAVCLMVVILLITKGL